MLARCGFCGGAKGLSFEIKASQGLRDAQRIFNHCLQKPCAGELEPSVRLGLAENLAAWSVQCGADLEQQFALYWGASGFEEACLAASASCRQLAVALRGEKVPYDPYSCIALVAFARWAIPPKARVLKVPPDLPSDLLADRDLVVAGREQGLPWRAIQLYLAGRSLEYLSARGWPLHAFRRLLDSLPFDRRESLSERHKQARINRGDHKLSESADYLVGIRQRYRSKVEMLVADRRVRTRERLRHVARRATVWLEENDPEWLERLVPSQRAAGPDLVDQRGRVVEFLRSVRECKIPHRLKEKTRVRDGAEAQGMRFAGYYRLLEHINGPLYRWMLANDSDWFHAAVEERKAEVAALRRGWQFDRAVLASHRKALGLNRVEYGALIGVCRSTVLRWETGRKIPRPAQTKAIGNLLEQMPIHCEEWREAYEAARTFDPLTLLVHRLFLGLTRTQYAELIGVDRHCVLFWETSRTIPKLEHRRRIEALVSRIP